MVARHVTGPLPAQPVPFTIVLHDELITEYALDSDLVLPGRRERRTVTLDLDAAPSVVGEARPALALGTRVYVDEAGDVRLCPPLGEPAMERRPGLVLMRRTRREVAVRDGASLVWALLRLMDGLRTTSALLAELAPDEREPAVRLMAGLAAAGVVDISGRPVARFIHRSTKGGMLPNGGLSADEIRRLATDGDYRAYPGALRVPVREDVPERLASLHALTRARRSPEDFSGAPVARADFEALLATACGVTGVREWAGRELKLRAYPSSGALYAVEIYPVVFAVEGLEPAVYHYRPVDSVLEVARPGIDRTPFLDAAVPGQRPMLPGVAAIICLAGAFTRSERKYGEGEYRFLAAEAGHISQNLLLAATALGLRARPCGSYFDALLNPALGLTTESEQFLLSVLVGHAAPES